MIFDYLIADILNNVRLAPKVTELLISGIKTNIALVFNTQHV